MAGIREIREMAGTELKINISVEPLGATSSQGGTTMDDFGFECLFYPYFRGKERPDKGITVPKGQMHRVDASNYVAVVDTSVTGPGEIMCRLTADIEDSDCQDGYRREIVAFPTGITVH